MLLLTAQQQVREFINVPIAATATQRLSLQQVCITMQMTAGTALTKPTTDVIVQTATRTVLLTSFQDMNIPIPIGKMTAKQTTLISVPFVREIHQKRQRLMFSAIGQKPRLPLVQLRVKNHAPVQNVTKQKQEQQHSLNTHSVNG